MDVEGSYEVLLRLKYLWSTSIFENETTALLKHFEICTEMHFVSLSFIKWKKYYNFTFDDAFKMYCCALC